MALSLKFILFIQISSCVNLPAINKTESWKVTLRQYPRLQQIKSKSKILPSISSAVLRLNDLITVISTRAMGNIIDLNAQKRHFLIKFIEENVTNKWMTEYELKKGLLSRHSHIRNICLLFT